MKPIIFTNIVGTINRSELFDFKLNDNLTEDSAKYFIIKSALKGNEYYSYIYSEGILKNTKEYTKQPQCLDIFDNWRFSFNNPIYFKKEVLQIDMNN